MIHFDDKIPNLLKSFLFSVDVAASESEKGNQCLPFRISRKCLSIAYNDKTVLSSRQGYIDAAIVFKEAYLPLIIASDCWKNHELFLSSLPAVNSPHVIFNTHFLQILLHLLDLPLVRRNKAKFVQVEVLF